MWFSLSLKRISNLNSNDVTYFFFSCLFLKLVRKKLPLTPRRLHKISVGVKTEVLGDSIYVKNLARSVFTDEVLLRSRVTGRRCTARQGTIARPSLPKVGKDYILSKYSFYFIAPPLINGIPKN